MRSTERRNRALAGQGFWDDPTFGSFEKVDKLAEYLRFVDLLLFRMQRDHSWIHTLIVEEAENERMHLMTFLALGRPRPLFRGSVIFTQFIFTGAFSLLYMISPHFCHR